MRFIIRQLYTGLLQLLMPIVLLRLWWKGRKLSSYRQNISERFGYAPFLPLQGSLWLHAVSVGEALAAIPLIKKFQQTHPNTPIVITTMTPTGRERVQAAFKDSLNKTVFSVYVPYDLPRFIKRLIRHIKPSLLIVMETEIWPNLFYEMRAHQIPIMIANARLSPHSAKWYGRFKYMLADLLKSVHLIAAQTAHDADNFVKIGIDQAKVLNTGNLKFDFELKTDCIEKGAQLKKALQADSIWIAASTHQTEEVLILESFKKLKKQWPGLVLILVPRHPDRFNEVALLCEKTGYKVHRRSRGGPLTEPTDIYLGDTMGEMMSFYAASDIAFVGGSFVPVGGHNLLEPASLQLPIISGPHLFNFEKIKAMLLEAEGLFVVQNQKALEQQMSTLLASDNKRHLIGARAHKVVQENRGALEKMSDMMLKLWRPRVHQNA